MNQEPETAWGFRPLNKSLISHHPTSQNSVGRFFSLCPKDFQQLLRLPKSGGLMANEASPHTTP